MKWEVSGTVANNLLFNLFIAVFNNCEKQKLKRFKKQYLEKLVLVLIKRNRYSQFIVITHFLSDYGRSIYIA